VTASRGLDGLADASLVVVPGWAPEAVAPPVEVAHAVRAAHSAGARLVATGTGAFLLGHAGLIDGRRVTTHWSAAARLAHLFPAACVQPASLFVDDGSILSSAGMTAGIDLALHVVRGDWGPEAAARLARRLMMPAHRVASHAEMVRDEVIHEIGEDPLPDLLDWMRRHLAEPQHLSQLADRVHMSPRTLTRRFQALTGTTPNQWLIRERLLTVQRLLEVSNDPIERIARRTGFPSATNMRQLFRRQVGTAPQSYRVAYHARIAGTPQSC
jgi:AraC family transcriptional activator FtrA